MSKSNGHGIPTHGRRAGILLHASSLPDGTCGTDTRRFIDFLVASSVSVWQLLPINPTDDTGSPYQSVSLHAGNPRLINLDDLVEAGWLDARHRHDGTWLEHALDRFVQHADDDQREEFSGFKARNDYWLEDYALFETLHHQLPGEGWWQWPEAMRLHKPDALEKVRDKLSKEVEARRFEQFLFFRQWAELADYAHAKGVILFGDMPIYPAHNSVDVWANQSLFLLDDAGQPTHVGGVPPDAFAHDGQRWGNPVYDWQRMQETGFTWWLDRVRTGLSLFDCLRVDHFRGYCACWHILASSPGAQTGEWHAVPGSKLLGAIEREHPQMPFVAEDLGVITDDVNQLRDRFHLPGTRVLQFAFDSDAANPHLPHNHPNHCVTFTGTHDNNTTLGWFTKLSADQKDKVLEYQGHSVEPMPWSLIRMNLASVAEVAIMPMQDLMALGESARMNTPGTSEGNWHWRFDWYDVDPELAQKFARLVTLYGRSPASSNY